MKKPPNTNCIRQPVKSSLVWIWWIFLNLKKKKNEKFGILVLKFFFKKYKFF